MATDDGYVCTLDEATLQKARAELNEDPKERLNAVQALREWILKQPHIVARTDTRTLVTILRGCKFSQLRAREMIEGNLSLVNKVPEWFKHIDTKEAKLLDIIKRGYVVPLPERDDQGSQCLLYRPGCLDHTTSVSDEIRSGIVVGSYIGDNELTQVNGSVFIFDFTGLSAKHMTRWKLDELRKWTKVWQKNVPGRFKAFHYYNAGTFFETMMAMVKPFLNKKFQERTHVHHSIEGLNKYVPKHLLPVDYLPDDYKGPHQGSVDDLIRKFYNHVTQEDFRQRLLEITSGKYHINESRRPKDDEPKSSFRKLNID